MNIYRVNYVIKHKRNGVPVFGTTSIIVADNPNDAEQIYRGKYSYTPKDKMLNIAKIGDENTLGEIWSY